MSETLRDRLKAVNEWAGQLGRNARTVNDGHGEPLAVKCDEAQAVTAAASAVVEAVEAFQAAERERLTVENLELHDSDELKRYAVAYQDFHAAKARLLEVNLG